MELKRECGILLHPTSLPSQYGIGDLGPEARQFIDFLYRSKQKLWQILPLNPIGFGESPFQCFSAFAGNPLLISIDLLVEEGLLSLDHIPPLENFNTEKVEYSRVKEFKYSIFRKAFENFKQRSENPEFRAFTRDTWWLGDFSLFMALKDHFQGRAWNEWEKKAALREPQALECYRELLSEEISYHNFLQYIFHKQWFELKKYANDLGVKIVGDLPIFISYDSSDAWANPQLFMLDQSGNPLTVAGVPPDYFSDTGQLWGNPHYRWEEMEKDDFQWWKERFKSLLQLVDIVRIDHFRGFEAYWEIPAGEETAINGSWVKAPGEKLFKSIIKELGEIPVIAEDLGIITPEVEELKEMFNFPGMKVLHFNLNPAEKDSFLPHNYEKNSVVYTGTHDNDTTVGWYKAVKAEDPETYEFIYDYLELDEQMTLSDICWRMIEVAYETESNTVIIPLQDILCLDTEARMNLPGTVGENWRWRYRRGSLTREIEERLTKLVHWNNR